MRKTVWLIALTLAASLSWAQDVDITRADFSKALLSIAGPDLVYVRGMVIDGSKVSALLKAEDDLGTRWKLHQVFVDAEEYGPETLSLEFAGIRAVSSTEVEISDIFLDGRPFSASFALVPPDTAVVLEPLSPVSLNESFVDRLSRVFGTLIEDEIRYYETRIAELESAGSESRMAIQSLEEKNRGLEDRMTELSDELTERQKRVRELEAETEALRAAGGDGAREYEELTRELEQARKELADALSAKDALQTQVRDLKAEQGVLTARIRELERKRTELEAAVEEAKKGASAAVNGGTEAARPAIPEEEPNPPSVPVFSIGDFSRTILSGFVQTIPQLGSWTVTKNEAVQLDGNQFFAKLIVPIVQTKARTLYSFEARSAGNGWIGFGLHIFADTKDKRKGYGFGNSLLVWITRDPNYYGSGETHLQVYRSSDAVQMEQVLDCIIEEPVGEYLPVDLVYDPAEEFVSVLVSGEHKLTYKTWFSIESGVEIALRTLGPGCQFRNLSIRRED